MVGVSGSNKRSLYMIATEMFLVQACIDKSHRRKAYSSPGVGQSLCRKAYCSAVPQRTICTLQQNSVRLYQESLMLRPYPSVQYVLSNIQYDCIRYVTEVVSVKLYVNYTNPMSISSVLYVSCTPSRVKYFILQYEKS